MPRSRTGIVAASIIALMAGAATFAVPDGAGDAPAHGAGPRHADAICSRAVRETGRLPRGSIARAAGMARILRSTASELRRVGADDLAWAHQRWAAAIDDVRQALRRRGGSARAGATALVAGREAAAAARVYGAGRCVVLAG